MIRKRTFGNFLQLLRLHGKYSVLRVVPGFTEFMQIADNTSYEPAPDSRRIVAAVIFNLTRVVQPTKFFNQE